MWCCVTGLVVSLIWTYCNVAHLHCRIILLGLCNVWRWYWGPLKCWNHWQNVMSQKTEFPDTKHASQCLYSCHVSFNVQFFLFELLVVVDPIKELFAFMQPEGSLLGTWDIVHQDKFNVAMRHVSTQAVVFTRYVLWNMKYCYFHTHAIYSTTRDHRFFYRMNLMSVGAAYLAKGVQVTR